MAEIFYSPYFGISLTIISFFVGQKIQKKTGLMICNPLLIAVVLIIGILLVFRIPYEAYQQGGAVINMFLAPATACLAVSIYNKIQILKEHWLPILVGCTCGSSASMISVYIMCKIFHLDDAVTAAMIPKSVTTPIAVSIAESLGGLPSITVVVVIFTGILGSIFAPIMLKIFGVTESMTAGISIGACSHAIGTSKAIQIGETEGAMSGLAVGICGIITVIFSIFI